MSRLDAEFVSRGMAATRSRAQQLIRAGAVRVNGRVQTKTGFEVCESDLIELDADFEDFAASVGRGSLKLRRALEYWKLRPFGLCLDIGASTGGFTQVLLESGADCVIAVDVGQNQLSEVLRADRRVVSLEKTDVRSLSRADLMRYAQGAGSTGGGGLSIGANAGLNGGVNTGMSCEACVGANAVADAVVSAGLSAETNFVTDAVVSAEERGAAELRGADFVVCDVSFISLTRIVGAIYDLAASAAQIILLVKPQFELEERRRMKGGVVKSEADRLGAVRRVVSAAEAAGMRHVGVIESPVRGGSGNAEYLAYFIKD